MEVFDSQGRLLRQVMGESLGSVMSRTCFHPSTDKLIMVGGNSSGRMVAIRQKKVHNNHTHIVYCIHSIQYNVFLHLIYSYMPSWGVRKNENVLFILFNRDIYLLYNIKIKIISYDIIIFRKQKGENRYIPPTQFQFQFQQQTEYYHIPARYSSLLICIYFFKLNNFS